MQRLLVGVIRAIRERCRTTEVGRESIRSHRHRATKGTRAICRYSCTSLHLNATHRGYKVGGIVPIHGVGVGVVHGNAVDGHVDARGIRTTQTYCRSTDAYTRLVSGND